MGKTQAKVQPLDISPDEAHRVHKMITELHQVGEGVFLKLGALLKQVRDKQLYLAMGHETFEAYIADPDIAWRRSTAYKSIAVYETFVEDLGLPPSALTKAGVDRLEIVRRVLLKKPDADPEEWVAKAEGTPRSDLREEVRRELGGAPASSEEGEKTEDQQVGRALVQALGGATVERVEYGRWSGVTLDVVTAIGDRVRLRVWSHAVLKTEVSRGV